MFVGVHGDKLYLRLSDVDRAEIMKDCKGVTAFEPMPGRAMKEATLSFQNPSILTINFLKNT
jgi:hypothetical protein